MTTNETTDRAREELRRTVEGCLTDGIGAACEWLASDEARELTGAAGLDHLSPARLLRELTGVSA
jgi:hypothetical protein